MLLQFRETADHESVLEVRGYHVLKQVHVTCAELAEALVHQATQFAVTFAPVINYVLDELVAVVQVLNNFIEVAAKQLFIRKELLLAQ